MESSDYIYGIRAVIEAVRAGKEIDKVLLRPDLSGELATELMSTLRENKIFCKRVPAEKLNRITRKNHQGVIAILSAVSYEPLSNLVPRIYEEGKTPFLVILDGITDVRNFGAIARTCECAGADGIVIPLHGSVSVSGDAMKTSAGALNHLPVCREKNISGAVRFLKNSGFQIVAASEKADINYTEADLTTPLAIVMGAEDVGISQDVLRLCDTRVSIPQFGQIGSLNVSVAAGVMIYEAVRQRMLNNMEAI